MIKCAFAKEISKNTMFCWKRHNLCSNSCKQQRKQRHNSSVASSM